MNFLIIFYGTLEYLWGMQRNCESWPDMRCIMHKHIEESGVKPGTLFLADRYCPLDPLASPNNMPSDYEVS